MIRERFENRRAELPVGNCRAIQDFAVISASYLAIVILVECITLNRSLLISRGVLMASVRSSRISQDPPGLYSPLLPTVVVASYKGGAGKTALAVPIAERLAFAGLRVLLMTCDTQEDCALSARRDSLGGGHRDPALWVGYRQCDRRAGRKSD